MKNIFTLYTTVLALLLSMLCMPLSVQAQDDVDIEGYANIYVRVEAVPQGGGQVFPSYQEANMKLWRDAWDFKQPVPVGSIMGFPVSMLYLYANAATADGYIFGGWYADNGDGVFNIEDDQLLSEDAEYVSLATLPEDTEIYPTQAAARNGSYPSEPSDLIFAYFTRGARVSLSYMQDDIYATHANCGTVWISNKANEPGDAVTIRAIPNDGFHFEYWQDADFMGNVISRDNPYTFTVQGGEHFYAYFVADDAPVFNLPEEGGFAVANIGAPWVLTDEAMKNGAHVLVMEAEDLVRTADGKIYLDMTNEEAQIDVAQLGDKPTLIYGKGQVSFAYKLGYGMGRLENDLVKWSGSRGVSLTGDVIYVYVFIPELGAFVQYGTTDEYHPDHVDKVFVPAGLAYFSMSAFDLTDDYGNIPTVIGLSPETYDKGVAGYDDAMAHLAAVEGVRTDSTTLRGQKVFTLSGVQVQSVPEQGLVIVGGKKSLLKK